VILKCEAWMGLLCR